MTRRERERAREREREREREVARVIRRECCVGPGSVHMWTTRVVYSKVYMVVGMVKKKGEFLTIFMILKLAFHNLCGVGGMNVQNLMSVGECFKGCCCDFNKNVNEL